MTATLRRSSQPSTRGAGRPGAAPRRRNRTVWLVPLLMLWLLSAAALLGLAFRRTQQGANEMGAARRSLGSAGVGSDQLAVHLQRARGEFRAAAEAATLPWLAPVRVVPVLGHQLDSFAALARAAEETARTGEVTVENAQSVLAAAPSTGVGRVGAIRDLARIASRADAALSRVSAQSRRGLVAPLRRRWAELDRDLVGARDSLNTAGQVLTAVGGLLDGPRHLLVLAANQAEMRAGSGMFLSAGTLDTDHGSLTLGPMHPTGDLALPDTGVDIDGDLAARWGWLEPGREWRNLATTPRFDATAPVAARMWERLTGESVDGVIAVDVQLLQAVLAVVGPVTVDDHVVTDATVVQYVLHDQYDGLDYDDAQGARREQLGRIAAATLQATAERQYSLISLARRVAAASRGRHVLAWSAQPDEQRAWHRAGVDGALSPTSMAVNVLNRGGNKLDQFLTVGATLDVETTAQTTAVALRVDVRNQTPPGQSPYVGGPHPDSGVGAGDYVGILAVNVPGYAADLALPGAPRLVAAGPDGPTQVLAAPFLLHPGEELSIVVRFKLPAGSGAMTVVPSAHVPAVTWRAGTQQWVDSSARVVRWR